MTKYGKGPYTAIEITNYGENDDETFDIEFKFESDNSELFPQKEVIGPNKKLPLYYRKVQNEQHIEKLSINYQSCQETE